MKEIIQLYTDTIKGNFNNSRSLLFLSEDYKAVDEALFIKKKHCYVDIILPVKTKRVSLCLICELTLNKLIR